MNVTVIDPTRGAQQIPLAIGQNLAGVLAYAGCTYGPNTNFFRSTRQNPAPTQVGRETVLNDGDTIQVVHDTKAGN